MKRPFSTRYMLWLTLILAIIVAWISSYAFRPSRSPTVESQSLQTR
jgi:hypothetical protein